MDIEEHKHLSHYNNLQLSDSHIEEIERFNNGWYMELPPTPEVEKDITSLWIRYQQEISSIDNINSAKYVIDRINSAFWDYKKWIANSKE